MSRRDRSHRILKLLAQSLIGLVLALLCLEEAAGHGGSYRPPPGTTGGPGTGGLGPRTTRGGARTARSKIAAQSMATWEVWWARNRYEFLDFPSALDPDGPFPLTPSPEGESDAWKALREKSCALYRPLLAHKSAHLRRAALIGLARLNDRESFPRMVELLRDPNQTVRDMAILALGILEGDRAKHMLLHIAKGTRTGNEAIDQTVIPDYFRAFAELAVALNQVRGAVPILQSILLDGEVSNEIKALAMESLGLAGGEDAAHILMAFIEKGDVSPKLLAAAVAALSKTRSARARDWVEKSLSLPSIPVRQSAALGLGQCAPKGDETMVRRLYQCYRGNSDQAIKGFALISMGQIGGSLAVEHLKTTAMTGNRMDCPWACLGLGLALRETPDKSAESLLLRNATTHANRSTRGAAAVALGLCRSKIAVDPLLKLLGKGDDPNLRGYCALVLGMIQDPSARDPLKTALREDPLPQVRTQASLALILLADPSAVPELIELLLNSSNQDIKGLIALNLSFTGDKRIVAELQQAMEGRKLDDQTLMHCIRLNARLLSGWTSPYLHRVAVGSNYVNEYPLVKQLLDFDV